MSEEEKIESVISARNCNFNMHVWTAHDISLNLLLMLLLLMMMLHLHVLYRCIYNWSDLNVAVHLIQAARCQEGTRIYFVQLCIQNICHREVVDVVVIVVWSHAADKIHVCAHLVLIYHSWCGRRC